MNENILISNSQRQAHANTLKKRVLYLVAFISILFAISLLIIGSSQAKSNHNDTSTAKTVAIASSNVPTKPDTNAGGAQVKTTGATVSKPVPKCVPLSTYTQPTAPSPNSGSTGLNQIPTQTITYDVFGNSIDQISNQIHSCSPVNHGGMRYAASTDYSINWSFKYINDESGLCKITDVYVGLHIIKVMPKWQPTASNPKLSKSWNLFYAHLDSHENSHANLDRKYAEKILNELQNMAPSSCESINTTANARANALITELNRANNQYDSSTSHGSTEGANL